MYTFEEKPDYRFAINCHGTLCGERTLRAAQAVHGRIKGKSASNRLDTLAKGVLPPARTEEYVKGALEVLCMARSRNYGAEGIRE